MPGQETYIREILDGTFPYSSLIIYISDINGTVAFTELFQNHWINQFY